MVKWLIWLILHIGADRRCCTVIIFILPCDAGPSIGIGLSQPAACLAFRARHPSPHMHSIKHGKLRLYSARNEPPFAELET